jgi:hypothetical protein
MTTQATLGVRIWWSSTTRSEAMIQKAKDTVMSWLVCLLPVKACQWLWHQKRIPLGGWAPHVLGRVLGVDPICVEP